MRFHSTPQSALNLEITKLAIAECVVSAALYLGICVHFRTFRYLASAVVVAPLMLFRTEVSANWGLKVYHQWTDRTARILDSIPDSLSYTEAGSIMAMLIATPMVGAALRILAPLYWAGRRPLQTQARHSAQLGSGQSSRLNVPNFVPHFVP